MYYNICVIQKYVLLLYHIRAEDYEKRDTCPYYLTIQVIFKEGRGQII